MSLHRQLSEAGAPVSADQPLYLLAEACAVPGLPGRLEFHGAHYQYLWHLHLRPGLENHAPLLLQLSPGTDLDTWLASRQATFACSVVQSTLPLAELASHLRRFGKVQQGRQRYFLRLGDPASLHLYVASLAQQPQALADLFAHGRIRQLYFHIPQTGLAQGVQPLFEQTAQDCEQDGCLAWLTPSGEVAR
ncbi:DUF4123 domain-containing protein [Pseudomonas sp. NMI760_13]|uniref:DUF4123 domain-containing protein n=1 Tax=Pseudomonas sp. NMI760_13 TaxID=2903147 RepID=UPI001E308C1B|nr:DUF4123 domain-containing protein [Pseudomonas sp. NMI760_13]MCE0918318.1 DUF4123 domain-containing protein [Pseudomonas sp. NMI760_13]